MQLRITDNARITLDLHRGHSSPVHLFRVAFASHWVELILPEIAVESAVVRHCCSSLDTT